jgi:hypothetical protein
MLSNDAKVSITDVSDIYSKGRFHAHFLNEPACPHREASPWDAEQAAAAPVQVAQNGRRAADEVIE